jgi:hypothetical protein
MEPDDLKRLSDDVYREEEIIEVRMSVRNLKVLVKMIEREKSMSLVWKYVFSIIGGITTIIVFWQLEPVKKFLRILAQ